MTKCKVCCPAKDYYRCYNVLENPDFEAGLTGWTTNNVIPANDNPFVGTQVASMGLIFRLALTPPVAFSLNSETYSGNFSINNPTFTI